MSERPDWDRQFAETEGERNARLRAKRLARNAVTEKVTEPCPTCEGDGLFPVPAIPAYPKPLAVGVVRGHLAITCPTCHGSGVTKGEE